MANKHKSATIHVVLTQRNSIALAAVSSEFFINKPEAARLLIEWGWEYYTKVKGKTL